MRVARAIAATDKNQDRLQQQAARQAVVRSSETAVQKEARLQQQAARQAASRACESPEELDSRRRRQAAWQAASRACTSPEQLNSRQRQQATRQAKIRACESYQQAEDRRQKMLCAEVATTSARLAYSRLHAKLSLFLLPAHTQPSPHQCLLHLIAALNQHHHQNSMLTCRRVDFLTRS